MDINFLFWYTISFTKTVAMLVIYIVCLESIGALRHWHQVAKTKVYPFLVVSEQNLHRFHILKQCCFIHHLHGVFRLQTNCAVGLKQSMLNF